MGLPDDEGDAAIASMADAAATSGSSALGAWRRSIEAVIAAGGPAIHLQPIVDLAEARVAGFEALARFASAPSAPDRWFNRAHQVGLGPELEASAIGGALDRRKDLGASQFLSINVSPAALGTAVVLDLFRAAAPLHGVVVELTEHDPMGDRPALDLALAEIRRLGGLIAIDDIGTGYAGLEWVLTVRPEMVKLDREFVRGVDGDEARATFVRFVGDLVDKLDTFLIAEGVETDGELDTLVALGVPLAQGYRLGHPTAKATELDPCLVDQIRRARSAFHRPTLDVAAHIEYAPSVRERPVGPPLAPLVVVIDAFGRPIDLLDGPGHLPIPHPLMRVKAGEDLHVVVQRALSRPESMRWAPVLVTNGAGRYEGIVRMERLVRALTELRSTTP